MPCIARRLIFLALASRALGAWKKDAEALEGLRGAPSLGGLEKEFGVRFHEVNGRSNCEEGTGKKCVGVVALSSLMWDSVEDVNNATGEAEAMGEEAERFLCGTMFNAVFHLERLRSPSSPYTYDYVLMHDGTVPERELALVRELGGRTLELSDSVKKLACRGMVRAGMPENKKITEEYCNSAKFDLNHWHSGHLIQFIQQLKLAAATLTEYDAVVFTDNDAFINEESELRRELDYFFPKPQIQLMGLYGYSSPINAGHWIARPNLTAVQIWLEDLREGFTTEEGWNHAGKVVPRPAGDNYSKDKPLEPSHWRFCGANRDQGLMFHVWSVKMGGYYAMGDRAMRIAFWKIHPTEANLHFVDYHFTSYNQAKIQHFAGGKKPWNIGSCQTSNPCHRQWIGSLTVDTLRYMRENPLLQASEFIQHKCLPPIERNVDVCGGVTEQYCRMSLLQTMSQHITPGNGTTGKDPADCW